jgi:hypothetical protein
LGSVVQTHEESDEAEVGADGDPERSERVIDEGHGQIDDRSSEREDTDSPEVDSEMRKTVKTLDVSDTLRTNDRENVKDCR